jgi:HK97 family phage major capsid protein
MSQEEEEAKPKEEEETKPEEEESDDEKDIGKMAEKIAQSAYQKFQNKVEKDAKTDDKKSKFYSAPNIAIPENPKEMSWEQKAFRFWQGVVRDDPEMCTKYSEYSQKFQPLVEGTAAMGGYLVPEEWYNKIVERKELLSMIRPVATVIPMTTDTLHVPKLDTEPKAYWRSEAAKKSTSTAQFSEITLTPYSKSCIVSASQEWAADAKYPMAGKAVAYIGEIIARALTRLDEKAFAQGSGSGQPTGIITYTPFPHTISAGGALAANHLIRAFTNLPPAYRQNGVWMGSTRTLATIRSLATTTGDLIFREAALLAGAKYPQLMGKDYIENDWIGDNYLYFGDFSYYYIGQREGLRIRTTEEASVAGYSAFEYDLVHIKGEERVDGEVALTDAFSEITAVRT